MLIPQKFSEANILQSLSPQKWLTLQDLVNNLRIDSLKDIRYLKLKLRRLALTHTIMSRQDSGRDSWKRYSEDHINLLCQKIEQNIMLDENDRHFPFYAKYSIFLEQKCVEFPTTTAKAVLQLLAQVQPKIEGPEGFDLFL